MQFYIGSIKEVIQKIESKSFLFPTRLKNGKQNNYNFQTKNNYSIHLEITRAFCLQLPYTYIKYIMVLSV